MTLPWLLSGCAGAAGAAGAIYLSPHLLRRRGERELAERCRRGRALGLTYDDGPGSTSTPPLLELLGESGAKATFFLLGERARRFPELVDRLAADGHEIALHGERHVNAWKSSPWRAIADIRQGEATIRRWSRGRLLFRPANGKMTLPTWWYARRRGHALGWWTVDSGDTHEVLPATMRAVETIRRSEGGVVLMHDFDRSRERMAFMLDVTRLLLDAARASGLQVKPLGEILAP
ncbi:MAG: polysaccharide deacetylase family protein [Planctomycetes bacterium]|nr:polysaccharide deacetylase family protein [Planctomycetota bacterium]